MPQDNKIKIRRGLDANLPAFNTEIGELRYSTDTKKLYIDDGTANIYIAGDVNDFPISTATQTALNSKQDKLQDAAGNTGVGKTDASATEKLDVNGNVKANSFIKSGGTSAQFLMADGTVNSNTYAKTDGTNATGTWGINITGNAATATNSTNALRVTFNNGPRNLSDRLPNSFTRTVNFDFVSAGIVGGVGNYAGVMTFSPWDGNTNSNGDSSYQLAFYNQTGINGSGIPGLKIRKGIDTTWNSWYKIYTDGDFSQTNINNWNTAFGWGSHAAAWNAASLSYSGSTLTLTINGISKTAKINAQRTITITGNTTLSETHNGAILHVTNTCNITIPTGLDANFQCVVYAKGSIIVTFVNGGVTLNSPSGLLLKTDKMASLFANASNTFNLLGELATS